MTSHLDGFDSDTLFNSMQEGGQGVFSLMVDPKKIVNVGEEPAATYPLPTQKREVLVGQEIRVALNERSVSPIAGDVKVVWSNGFEGDTYHVRAEDLGQTLTAVATFEGADMRPLEVTIECGPVVLAPPANLDVSAVIVVDAELPQDPETALEIREFRKASMFIPVDAFDSEVTSVDVQWFVDGTKIGARNGVERQSAGDPQSAVEPQVLPEADLALLRSIQEHKTVQAAEAAKKAQLKTDLHGNVSVTSHNLQSQDLQHIAQQLSDQIGGAEQGQIIEFPHDLTELPNMLAELLAGDVLPGLGGFEVVQSEGSAQNIETSEDSTADESSTDSVTELDQAEDAADTQAASLYFVAQQQLPQGVAGGALSLEITAHAPGAESSSSRVFVGVVEEGDAYALHDGIALRVADPRVGEDAWVKVKRKHFTPTPSKFTYQWLINGEELVGETSSRIDVIPEMRGRDLSVLIEVSGDTAMTSTVEASLGVVTLGDAPEYLGDKLEVLGKARVGKTVKLAFDHQFVIPEPDSIEVQWMRGREPIVGARGLSYEVGVIDVDEKLWARVLLRRVGHATSVLKSNKVRVKD